MYNSSLNFDGIITQSGADEDVKFYPGLMNSGTIEFNNLFGSKVPAARMEPHRTREDEQVVRERAGLYLKGFYIDTPRIFAKIRKQLRLLVFYGMKRLSAGLDSLIFHPTKQFELSLYIKGRS